MKISKEDENLSSGCGVLLTILLTFLMLAFLYTKVLTWHFKKDVDVMGALIDHYYSETDRFNATNGFFVAAGLTNYDSNTTLTEEKRFGELVFEHYGWGNHISGSKPLKHHFCSDEELGLTDSKTSLTYPMVELQKDFVESYKNKMKCLDAEDYEIYGDYNSAQAQQLKIKFKMCEGEDYCESKEDIKKWLANKFIVLIHNQ